MSSSDLKMEPIFESKMFHFSRFKESRINQLANKICQAYNDPKYVDIVMGGRSRLANDKPHFYNEGNLSKPQNQLYKVFNEESIVRQFLTLMVELFPLSSEKERIELVLKKGVFDVNGALKQSSIINRIRRLLFKTKFRIFFRPKYFLHFDFSSATNGYYREPHLDGENRMLAGLIYFNFPSIESAKGGELGIYEPKFSSNKRQLLESECDLIELITPTEGDCICFLNDNTAYHGVPKMDGFPENEKRYFCYFGISTEMIKNI